MFAANLAGTGDTPVFRMGLKYYGQTNEHVLDALTRDKWLTGIANGIDYMTASNIEKLVQGSGKEMESLGRLGSKQDKEDYSKAWVKNMSARTVRNAWA